MYDWALVFPKDLIGARNGELAKNAELVQLRVIDLDPDDTGCPRYDNYWARRRWH